MNKRLIFIALTLFMGLVMASCGTKSLEGTWVEPAAEYGLGDVGFTLLQNGEVVSINTGYREYKQWEKVGKKLIIKGEYTGTNPHEFADTLDIISVDDEKLVLGQGEYRVTYQKR